MNFVLYLYISQSVLDSVVSGEGHDPGLIVNTACSSEVKTCRLFLGWGWLCQFAGPTMEYQMNMCYVAMEGLQVEP